MLMERTVIRHLYGRPLETLLATWGISLLIIQIVRMTFGAQNVTVANPEWLDVRRLGTLTGADAAVDNRIAIMAFRDIRAGAGGLIAAATRLGLFVRAVTQNRRMADNVGVPTGRIDMLAFGLGSGIAGLGGVALSQFGNVGPDTRAGVHRRFVHGGGARRCRPTGRHRGGRAWALASSTRFLEPLVGAVLGKILVLVFIIMFIQKRPQGCSPSKAGQID
jgi:urea transport system permease protein